MNDLLKAVDELPLILMVILCIPCIDVFYGICRIVKGATKNDMVWLILGILTVFPGAFFMWVLDLVWVLLKGHALLLGEEMFS